MPKTVTLDTGEWPVVKAALEKKRRPSWLKRLFMRRKRSYVWHKRIEDIPQPMPILEPLTFSEVEERSARGVAKRTTQELRSTDRIDLSKVKALI
jgi:hypothetical protein